MFAPILLSAAGRAAASLPWELRLSFARLWAGIQLRCNSRRRRAVLSNLAHIDSAGHCDAARAESRTETARSMLASGFLSWIEYFAARGQGSAASSTIRFEGSELLYRALARGGGMVLTLPHLGCWELMGLAGARLGFRLHVVTGVQLHPALSRAARRLKESDRIRVSTPSDGFGPLLRTLRAGGVVVLLVDGDVATRTIEVSFFGSPTPFPIGPALLARRAGVPLLHGHAVRREDGTHAFCFDAIDEPDPALPVRRDLERMTASMARAQERNIERHVTQWCIFRPIWTVDAA